MEIETFDANRESVLMDTKFLDQKDIKSDLNETKKSDEKYESEIQEKDRKIKELEDRLAEISTQDDIVVIFIYLKCI